MRIILTFLWSLGLVCLLSYVGGSIAGIPFDFQTSAIVSLFVSVLIIVLGESLPEEPVSDH